MMEDNWYAPDPVHCRQMTEEERQYYQEQRRKRHFPLAIETRPAGIVTKVVNKTF